MATSPTLVSVEEYLHTSYHPDCDYVDGELEVRHVGEYTHGDTQRFLLLWCAGRMQEWQIDPMLEQRIYLVLPDLSAALDKK